MEIGESAKEAIIREVKEETGLAVEPRYIVGIYSNPRHVIAFSDGEVRQEFSICFACKIIGGRLQVSEESTELRFFKQKDLPLSEMHESIRQRIGDYQQHKKQAYFS